MELKSFRSSELREIQKQLDNLPNPRSAEQAAELLTLKRNVLYLEFDVCIRHVLPETFLASGNIAGYKSVAENMRQPLTQLSSAQVACLDSVAMDVPSPLEARDATAQQLFPWRSFASRRGPYSSMQWQWWTVGTNMQLCLAGLRDVDKPTVHGELLSMSLCLEDVAKTGDIPESFAGKPVSIEDRENFLLIGKRMLERVRKRPEDEASASASSTHLLLQQQQQQQMQAAGHSAVVEQAREACRLQIRFLVLWKRVDALKYFWARNKMNVSRIDTVARYQQFCKLYKSEKLYPIMRSLALQYGQEELCEPGPLQADTDVFVTPQGVPEMTVRQRQAELMKLLEFVESHMINEVRKRLHRETDQVIKERNREEDNLPTDLWKRSCMKESFSLKRPPFLEEFLTALDKEAVETDDGRVVFSADGLNRCLNQLCVLSTQNQRETYESYASYYESILRQQHQVLYDRERQMEHLQTQIREKEESVAIEAQLLMAETVHSLLMEVTALRAKVSEMREQTIRQKTEIRDSVRSEYNDLVQSLFACNFEQKMRLDEYRKHILSATMARISDVRTEASETMSKIRERTATSRLVTEKELSERNDRLSESLAQLDQENVRLGQLMNRQKALFNWKQTYARCEFQKKLSELDQEKEHQRKRATAIDLVSTEKTQQLTQELAQAKECLVRTERELGETRRKLDRLQRDDLDRRHADERRDRSDRQLADAKQLHIDKLMEEITETRRNFKSAKDDLTRSFRTQQTIADKTTKQVDVLRQQLKEEKRLKEDAFGKVDNLLSQLSSGTPSDLTESRQSVRFATGSPDVQVYELESVAGLSRAQTSIGFSQPLATDSRARPGSTRPNTTLGGGRRSASVTGAVSRPVSSVGGGVGGGYAPLPRWTQKSLTPDLRLPPRPPTASTAGFGAGGGGQSNGHARPKTVGASSQRLRAKLAEQLLYNIEPEHHSALMQLKDASATGVN